MDEDINGSVSVRDLMKKMFQEKNLTKEQQKEVIKEALKIAEDSDDYCNIATNVCHDKVLADKTWGRVLFKEALEKVDTEYGTKELYNIALQIASKEQLNDKNWAKEIYTDALKESEDIDDLISIANNVTDPDGISDKELAKNALSKALSISSDTSEKIQIAQNIAHDDILGDKEWARNIIKSFDHLDFCDDAREIALLYAHKKLLNDKESSKNWFEQAIEIESEYDYYEIASLIFHDDVLGNKVWAADLCLQGYTNEFDIQTLIEMSKLVYQTSQDKAKEIIDYAIKLVESDDDYSSDDLFNIAAHISENKLSNISFFNDKEWGEFIFEKAIQKAETEEDKNLIRKSMKKYL